MNPIPHSSNIRTSNSQSLAHLDILQMDNWTCQLVGSSKETKTQGKQVSLSCVSGWWKWWERGFLLLLQSLQVFTFLTEQTQNRTTRNGIQSSHHARYTTGRCECLSWEDSYWRTEGSFYPRSQLSTQPKTKCLVLGVPEKTKSSARVHACTCTPTLTHTHLPHSHTHTHKCSFPGWCPWGWILTHRLPREKEMRAVGPRKKGRQQPLGWFLSQS